MVANVLTWAAGIKVECLIFELHCPHTASHNVGLEPMTLRLRVSCSTDYASQAVIQMIQNEIQGNWHDILNL